MSLDPGIDSGAAFGIMYDRLLGLLKNGSVRTEARKWVASTNVSYGSFNWCCRVLGINQDKARSRLNKLNKSDLANTIILFHLEKEAPNEESTIRDLSGNRETENNPCEL